MDWGDFVCGVWMGVLLTCVLEVVAIGVWAVFSDLFARLKKLETASREEGRDDEG